MKLVNDKTVHNFGTICSIAPEVPLGLWHIANQTRHKFLDNSRNFEGRGMAIIFIQFL